MVAGLSITSITTVPTEPQPGADFAVKITVKNSGTTEATGVILVCSYNGTAIGPAASGGGVYVGTTGNTTGDGKVPPGSSRDTSIQIAGQPEGAASFTAHLANDLAGERTLAIYIGTKPAWWFWIKEHPEYSILAIAATVGVLVLIGKIRGRSRGVPGMGQVIPYEQKIPIPYPVSGPPMPLGLDQMRFGPIMSGGNVQIDEDE